MNKKKRKRMISRKLSNNLHCHFHHLLPHPQDEKNQDPEIHRNYEILPLTSTNKKKTTVPPPNPPALPIHPLRLHAQRPRSSDRLADRHGASHSFELLRFSLGGGRAGSAVGWRGEEEVQYHRFVREGEGEGRWEGESRR